MDPVTISSLVGLGTQLIQRIWADPVKQAEELRKLQELEQQGDIAELNAHVQLMLGQIEVNKIEASKEGFFTKWRPAVGWLGVFGLSYQFIVYPLFNWIWVALQAMGAIDISLNPPPVLETEVIITIVMSMLGVGTMRSWDKKNGVVTNSTKG